MRILPVILIVISLIGITSIIYVKSIMNKKEPIKVPETTYAIPTAEPVTAESVEIAEPSHACHYRR